MIIKKQPVISWLLEKNYALKDLFKITPPNITTKIHIDYLFYGIKLLNQLREKKTNWGLPELLMPSFEKVMKKSAKSFYHMDHKLFQEFHKDNVCGILIHRIIGTIVYSFSGERLYVWIFRDVDGHSIIHDHFYFTSTPDNVRHLHSWPTIINDPQLYNQQDPEHEELYSCIANLLITYLAVKKYAEVEIIVIPENSKKIVEDGIQDYKQKKKIINESGQEVRIMDSRWFVKIVNDNDISVRSFFRMQPYKNENGEWDRRLTRIPPHTRHGYHRNAGIEDESIDL